MGWFEKVGSTYTPILAIYPGVCYWCFYLGLEIFVDRRGFRVFY